MTAPTVIRASALSLYPDCPRRTAARLFWREIAAAGFKLRHVSRGIGAAIGSSVHQAAAAMLREKAQKGTLPPTSFATDAARDGVIAELQEGEILFDPTTPNRGQAVIQSVEMTRGYHRTIAPGVEPILVEERLEAEVMPGLVLSGQPDVVAREPARLRDVKTSSRPRPGSHAPQLGAYALLVRTHGLDVEEAAIDHVQRVPPHKLQPDPQSKPVPITQAETAASSILKHIEGDLATFRAGDPERRILPGDPWAFQANPASILCSPKYCPAFGTDFCREGDAAKEIHK
jgi:PD-(D/E)XK nuclease superfamily